MNKPLVILVGGGLLYWWLNRQSQVSAVNNMRFLIEDIGTGGSVLKPEVWVRILCQNPTDTTIAVSSMVGEVFLNGDKLGNLSSFTPFNIAPNNETKFEVRTRISLIGVFTQIVAIINGSAGIAAQLKIVGTVNVGGTLVPIQLTHNVV